MKNSNVSISEILGVIIDAEIPDFKSDTVKMLRDMELPGNNINIMTAMLAETAKKAMSGDLKALEWIVEILGLSSSGEKPLYYSGIPGHLIGRAYVDIYRDIIERRHRFYDFKGGRGSLKSSFCALVMIDEIIRNENFCGIALRQVKDTLADSVYAQLKWAIDKLGFANMFKFTVSPMQMTKLDTGQIIYFRGCDEPMKIKSIKPPKDMYIGVVWFEEKDQLNGPEAVRSIQQSVMRGGDDIIVLSSYNTPISRRHFLNREEISSTPSGSAEPPPLSGEAKNPSGSAEPPPLSGEAKEASAKPPLLGEVSRSDGGVFSAPPQISNRIIHHSYYYDTPKEWLGQPFLDEAEYLKSINEKAYRHEYLGEAIGEGGNVFENVTVKRFTQDEQKKTQKSGRFYHGVDWGYYPAPWAYIKCCYFPKDRRLYITDESSAYKKSNHETAGILLREKNLTKDDMLICDSSEPKSVTDYVNCGLYARGAEKGGGSVAYSMRWLQSLSEIIIDAQKCPNAAKEFLEYEYERDSDGEVISGYPDRNNHFIDAARYATNLLWRRETK